MIRGDLDKAALNFRHDIKMLRYVTVCDLKTSGVGEEGRETLPLSVSTLFFESRFPSMGQAVGKRTGAQSIWKETSSIHIIPCPTITIVPNAYLLTLFPLQVSATFRTFSMVLGKLWMYVD